VAHVVANTSKSLNQAAAHAALVAFIAMSGLPTTKKNSFTCERPFL